MFVWLVADGWCWFVLREKYCWLVAGGWFVLREKYCWLVADKPSIVRAQYTKMMKTSDIFRVSQHVQACYLCYTNFFNILILIIISDI
jgi:hypothetical protein